MESTISLKKFNDEIEEHLLALDTEALRSLVRSFADEVKPVGRGCFLSKLSPSCSRKVVLEDDILDEIEGLMETIESRFEEEPDWDDYDYDAEDPGPDADSVEAVSSMFDRVNAIFDYGDTALAREAYEKLFAVLDLEDDYGRTINAYDLEDIDLKEIRARYLRSVYLSLSREKVAPILIDKLQEMRSFFRPEPPSLSEIIEISSDPLPDWKVFLDAWMAFLKEQNDNCAKAMLREAIFLRDGAQGLKNLSKSQGLENPRIFYDLVNYYKSCGEEAHALSEAQNALSILPEGMPIRAAIADQIIDLVDKKNDDPSFFQALWITFQEKPTLKKLLELFIRNEGESRKDVMEKAVLVLDKRVKSGSSYKRNYDTWENDNIESPSYPTECTLLHAYFLAENQRAAFDLVVGKKELGWSYGEHPQPIFLGLCFFQAMPIKQLGESPQSFQSFWKSYLSDSANRYGLHNESSIGNEIKDAYEELKKCFECQLDSKAIQWCFDIAKKRVFSIVSNQHRGAYHRAALLTAVCYEVLQALGKPQEAINFYKEIKNTFPRHSAFQRELKYVIH